MRHSRWCWHSGCQRRLAPSSPPTQRRRRRPPACWVQACTGKAGTPMGPKSTLKLQTPDRPPGCGSSSKDRCLETLRLRSLPSANVSQPPQLIPRRSHAADRVPNSDLRLRCTGQRLTRLIALPGASCRPLSPFSFQWSTKSAGGQPARIRQVRAIAARERHRHNSFIFCCVPTPSCAFHPLRVVFLGTFFTPS